MFIKNMFIQNICIAEEEDFNLDVHIGIEKKIFCLQVSVNDSPEEKDVKNQSL